MKKAQIAQRVAEELRIHPGKAADELDRILEKVLGDLRRQGAARVRGLGTVRTILPGPITEEGK